jgi:C1A family cysteine protease
MADERNRADTLAELRSRLAELGDPWRAGETRMTLLPESARSVRLGVPAPSDAEIAAREGQEQAMAAAALSASGMRVAIAGGAADGAPAALPSAFDLRDVGGADYTTPIRDQGQCGSCVAFGVVAVMESTAEYTRGAPGLDLDLSEGHLFNVLAKARGYTCATGSWPDDLFEDASATGITFEDYAPYQDNGTVTLDADWPNRLAKAVGVKDLTGNPAAMKQHIYTYGAIAACFVVYQDFFSYKSGVYTHTTDQVAGGHCISIIGWDDAQGCWICKNQWGPGWGDRGYFRIAYGDSFIEDYPGDRPTVFGCTSVSIKAWLTPRRTQYLFATANDNNGWAFLENFGWVHLSGGPAATNNKLVELTHSRASGRPVQPYVDGTELRNILVFD